MLWSWAFYPQFIGQTRHIWPYSTTKRSRNTRRHVPGRKENWTHLVKLHSWRPAQSTPVFFPAPQILKSQICCFSASLSTRRVRVDLVLVFNTYMKICCGDLWQAFVFLIKGIKPSYGVLHLCLPLLPLWKVEAIPGYMTATLAWAPQERCQDRTERWEEFDLWMTWMNYYSSSGLPTSGELAVWEIQTPLSLWHCKVGFCVSVVIGIVAFGSWVQSWDSPYIEL